MQRQNCSGGGEQHTIRKQKMISLGEDSIFGGHTLSYCKLLHYSGPAWSSYTAKTLQIVASHWASPVSKLQLETIDIQGFAVQKVEIAFN